MLDRHLSNIVYLAVFLGIALPGAVAWTLLVVPHRPAAWLSVAVSCGLGTAIALLANVAERIVVRRSEQKPAARAKAVS